MCTQPVFAIPGRPAPAGRTRGFTLIELMIVVAVVAILAAIGYPSYTEHVRKSRRATAQAALMDLASRQQAYLLDRRAYAGTLADLSLGVPLEIQGYYTVTIVADNAASPRTFLATATPINAQSVSGELALTIDQSGARTPLGRSGYWGK